MDREKLAVVQVQVGHPRKAFNGLAFPGLKIETWGTHFRAGSSARNGGANRRRAHSRLINDAIQAAPKPLSIFTTLTFGEQVFNMPRSAATPPNDAP